MIYFLDDIAFANSCGGGGAVRIYLRDDDAMTFLPEMQLLSNRRGKRLDLETL